MRRASTDVALTCQLLVQPFDQRAEPAEQQQRQLIPGRHGRHCQHRQPGLLYGQPRCLSCHEGEDVFVDHTAETAPEAARTLATTEKHLGYLPVAVARMAEAPLLLDGFLKLSAMFEATSLDPLARETLVMTIATRNGCHLCVAMHTARLHDLDADPALI